MGQPVCCAMAVLCLFAVWAPQALNADAESVNPEAWYERMRQPWNPQKRGFIREWLVLGEFPKPPIEGDEAPSPGEPCAGCDTDYLTEHGGEQNIQPKEGMTHTRPDGSQASWSRHVSDENVIDLTEVLSNRPTDNAIAYAFTTVHRQEAGPAILAVGSDDGVMIWVNGKLVHRNIRAVSLMAGSG